MKRILQRLYYYGVITPIHWLVCDSLKYQPMQAVSSLPFVGDRWPYLCSWNEHAYEHAFPVEGQPCSFCDVEDYWDWRSKQPGKEFHERRPTNWDNLGDDSEDACPVCYEYSEEGKECGLCIAEDSLHDYSVSEPECSRCQEIKEGKHV